MVILVHIRYWFALILCCLVFGRAGAQAPPLALEDAVPVVDLWPGLRMLSDPLHTLTLPEALARDAQFHPPGGPRANLGPRADAVWLRTSLEMPWNAGATWWLSIDFLALDEIDVYLVTGGQVVQHVFMSNHLPFQQRPSAARRHSARLSLQPGLEYELVLRVRKYVDIAMLMPVSLMQTNSLLEAEAGTEFWQSLLFGLGLCLVVYSLIVFLLNSDRLYLWFALFAASCSMLWFCYFGLASQHLWPEAGMLNATAPLFCMLLIPIGAFRFVDQVLNMAEESPRASRLLRVLTGLLALLTVLYLAGLASHSLVAVATGLIGPWPMLLATPLMIRRGLRRDRLALWALAGWIPHAIGLTIGVGLHRGWLPWNFWTDHAAQSGAVLDLLAWTMLMSVRASNLRRAAARGRLERDRLLIMAQTDALTGLLNRRGLQDNLNELAGKLRGHQILALYVIDLDGFKPVNDRYGHAAGDEALVLVGQRLKNAVRGGDLVCRLGGDEFVVVTQQYGEAQTRQVAEKLFSCCNEPFVLSGAVCELGMTIGYALTPNDARDTELLFKYADAAMYEGKRAGKRQIRRARSA